MCVARIHRLLTGLLCDDWTHKIGYDRYVDQLKSTDGPTQWTHMADMCYGRQSPLCGVVDDYCYIIGGRAANGHNPKWMSNFQDSKGDSTETSYAFAIIAIS